MNPSNSPAASHTDTQPPTPRDETERLIFAIQTATPRSRERLAYAASAWGQLDAAGQAAIEAERPANIERAMYLNNGLAVSIARHWLGLRGRRLEGGDLLAAGQSGILNALFLFDLSRGWRFSTYASASATSEILKESYGLTDLAQPGEITRGLHRLRAAGERFEQEHGREPNRRELARLIDIDVKTVEVLLAIPEVFSADGFDPTDDESSVPEVEQMREPMNAEETVEAAEIERLTSLTWDEAERDLAPAGKGRP